MLIEGENELHEPGMMSLLDNTPITSNLLIVFSESALID
jgi:hypothetical protein